MHGTVQLQPALNCLHNYLTQQRGQQTAQPLAERGLTLYQHCGFAEAMTAALRLTK